MQATELVDLVLVLAANLDLVGSGLIVFGELKEKGGETVSQFSNKKWQYVVYIPCAGSFWADALVI